MIVLEDLTHQTVDLLDATDLFKRRRALAYRIVRDGLLLVDQDHEALGNLKKQTRLLYPGTNYL